MQRKHLLLLIMFALALSGERLRAFDIPIANASFENPVVNENISPVWLAAPPWVMDGPGMHYNLGDGVFRNGNTGIFPNPDAGRSDHFTNPHLNQLAYIFTGDGEYFTQELETRFAANTQYDLTIAVANAGAAPNPDLDRLHISLAYLNDSSVLVPIATRIVMNNATFGPLSGTQLSDFTLNTPILPFSPVLTGKKIQILLNATGMGAAEFVMDNVRLDAAGGGDADRNGVIDASDLGRLARNWQMTGGWGNGDFTQDGFVDINDLRVLASNWPAAIPVLASLGLPTIQVPEPAFLGVFGLLLPFCRRQRRV